MIRDLLYDTPDSTTTTDICIVGAGAAGIVLALELIRQGKSVTLLEGGGAQLEDASQEPYRSEVVGLPHNGVHTGRFRAQGGTTHKWGGQILPLEQIDLDRRDWVPGSGWSLTREQLDPYYARALSLEGLENVQRQDEEIWRAAGQSAPKFEALDTYFSRWCPEPRFAELHRDALANSPGLTVWLHANAVELHLDGEQATGVRCRTLTGREHTFTARQYVFSLGAIESSRFFLQPRPGGLPWNQSGLLGQHFQDHIDANAATLQPLHPARFHAAFDNVFLRGFKYHPKIRLSPDTQRARQTLSVAATMHFLSDVEESLNSLKSTARRLLKGRFREVSAVDLTALAANLPLLARQSYRYAVQHRAYNPPGKIMLRLHCEQEPLSRSSITLAESRDSLGLLRTRLDWQISAAELASMRTFVELAATSLAGLATVTPDSRLVTLDPAFATRCDDSSHHMGGMVMHASPRQGCVDEQLRLHGTRNAYVCSSAVFPTSGNSNPTHTLLALAIRLADHLAC